MVKKNSNGLLFLLLCLSLGGVYLFIEKDQLASSSKTISRLKIVDLVSDCHEVQTGTYKWLLKDNKWVDEIGFIPLQVKLIQEFFGKFNKLKIVREITAKELENENKLSFIPHGSSTIRFYFQNNPSIAYSLGTHLGISEGFYLEEIINGESKVYLVEDLADSSIFYDPNSEPRKDYKYRKWQTLFTLKGDIFWDRRVFPGISDVDKFWISIFKGENFVVHFNEGRTDRPAPKGILFNRDYSRQFLDSLLSMRAKNFHLFRRAPIRRQLAKGKIFQKNGDTKLFYLMGEFNLKNGYYLKFSGNNLIYELSEKDSRLFFSSKKDFWSKRALAHEKKLGERDVSFSLKFKNSNKSYKFMIPKSKKFNVEPVDKNITVNQNSMKNLFNLLVGGPPFGEADSVEASKKPITEKKTSLKIKIGENSFLIDHKNDELIVSNLEYNYQLKYLVGKKAQFKTSEKDYILKR